MSIWKSPLRVGLMAVLAVGVTSALAESADTGRESVAGSQKQEGILERVEAWRDRMSRSFSEAWEGLWTDQDALSHNQQSLATAAIDVRESGRDYTVRMHLPGRDLDSVQVELDQGALRIIAPSGDQAGRYEQTLALEGVGTASTVEIERDAVGQTLVVTVPKVDGDGAEAKQPTVPALALQPLNDWERSIFERMERMRLDMDRVFEEAMAAFDDMPAPGQWANESAFGGSIDLREKDDHYVASVYLPDHEMENVNVTVENGMLTVEAVTESERREQAGNAAILSRQKSAYSQSLALPGPVDASAMQVERKEGMLVVTLPKRNA